MSFSLSSSKFFSFMWVHFFTFREHFHKRLDSRNMIFTATARNLQCHWYLTDILSCSVFGTEKVFSKSANRSSIEEYSIAKMFLCSTSFNIVHQFKLLVVKILFISPLLKRNFTSLFISLLLVLGDVKFLFNYYENHFYTQNVTHSSELNASMMTTV